MSIPFTLNVLENKDLETRDVNTVLPDYVKMIQPPSKSNQQAQVDMHGFPTVRIASCQLAFCLYAARSEEEGLSL